MNRFFFDVGANVGQTFDWHLCITPDYDGWSIFCFEPSTRHIGPLRRKAKEMAARYDVTVCPFAFGNPARTQILFEKQDPEGDSLFPETYVNGKVRNRTTSYRVAVAVLKLSRFIYDHTKQGAHIEIKLDAEGAEYEIVEDLLEHPDVLRRIWQMHIEWHRFSVDGVADRAREIHLMESLSNAGVPVKIWPH